MAHNGRELTIDWDSTTVVGVRTRGYTINNEHVDVTTDDANGWRTLLDDPGVRSIEVTVAGIVGGGADGEEILGDIMAASVTGKTCQVTLPSSQAVPGTLSGTFQVTNFENNGEHDGAAEFSATFVSSGAVTYTASAAT